MTMKVDEPGNGGGPRLLTVRGVSERYSWGRSTTYQLLGQGKLKATKIGSRLLIFADSCEALVASLPIAKISFRPRKTCARD